MMKVVSEGGILGLAADQDARKSGVFVNFLGRPASAFRGPAVFHLKTGAPLILALCRMDKQSRYHISFERLQVTQEDSVETITQKIASKLEEAVFENPEQYFWFHRRWKTQPRK
jgi:KDO2-lipid IV(A) lauroyltransferase